MQWPQWPLIKHFNSTILKCWEINQPWNALTIITSTVFSYSQNISTILCLFFPIHYSTACCFSFQSFSPQNSAVTLSHIHTRQWRWLWVCTGAAWKWAEAETVEEICESGKMIMQANTYHCQIHNALELRPQIINFVYPVDSLTKQNNKSKNYRKSWH